MLSLSRQGRRGILQPDGGKAARADAVNTFGMWFGSPGRPLAGWWTASERPSRDGVVIAPPLGYEYWSTHRSLRTLAESIARAGRSVLRFDWDGTGDSAGDARDPGRVAAWHASLAEAVKAMREAGVERVVLVGLCLGAAFTLLDAAELGVDEVVVCALVASGKRFIKQLKMLGVANPEKPDDVMYSGLAIDANTAAELATINLDQDTPAPVARTLIVTRGEPGDKLVKALRADGRDLATVACGEMRRMLDVPSEDATVPPHFVASIVSWLGEAHADALGAPPARRESVDMPWQGGRVRETFMEVAGLTAVHSSIEGGRSDFLVVFLNSGSEPHIGPGRAWVEYARGLALHGYGCLRVDFSGWGESPDEGHAPGRPYDAHCVAETLRIVAALREQHAGIVLVGLCASAWIALKAAQQDRVEGVFALNPQLYWKPGDPVEALMADTHRRRTSERLREARGARWKYWSLLDLLGIRPMAARWLIALRKHETPVMLSFAEGDDGLTYLRDRCGRRLAREMRAGYLTVEEMSGIDHQMYRVWRRPAVIEQMVRFLDSLPQARTTSRE
jgi:pimeloyl-ACP methyl ester carboxylesterase